MAKEEIEDFSFYNEEEDDIYVGERIGNNMSNRYLCQYAIDCIDDFRGGSGGGGEILRDRNDGLGGVAQVMIEILLRFGLMILEVAQAVEEEFLRKLLPVQVIGW